MKVMRTFRFPENDISTLEAMTDKITKAAKKEGMTFEITKTIVLRALISFGSDIPVKDIVEKIKQLKIYG